MLNPRVGARPFAATSVQFQESASFAPFRSVLRCACVFFIAIGSAGCGTARERGANQELLGLELQDGRTIEQLSSDTALSIVMLMGSSECLSCSSDLNRWVEIAREKLGHATLVLTSAPQSEVHDALVRLRLPYAIVRLRDEERALSLVPSIVMSQHGKALIVESRIAQARRAVLVDSGRLIVSHAGKLSR